MSGVPAIRLRAPCESDFPILAGLRRDRDVQHMLTGYPPVDMPSDEQVREWIASRLKAPGGTFLSIVDESDRAVGFVQIADVHLRGRFGKLGIAVAHGARGRGVGGSALALICRHASGSLGLRKLLLEVRADNAAAIRLYSKMKFRQIGVLSAHYHDGQNWHDVVLMERLLDAESDA